MSTSLTKKKLLIVEDEYAILKILRVKFEKFEEIEVSIATNGKEGLKKAFSGHPDLILLDIIMPHMDGIEMLTELREDEWGKDARVVILTNYPYESKQTSYDKLGPIDFIIKSDRQISEVMEKVLGLLGILE